MSFSVFRFIALLVIILMINPGYAEELVRNRMIRVNGIGKTLVKPDKADLTLAIEVQARNAEEARQQAAVIMDNVIKAVKNQDIEEKDIQTTSVSLYPNYSPNGGNKIVGYQLSNQVVVIVRNVDKASEVIDAAVRAGGNATRLQGINFGVDNPDKALGEARSKAFASAKAKAEQYANLAGVELGEALQISEGHSEVPPMPVAYMERSLKATVADASSTPIQAGEQEVSVTVDVSFAIK